MSITILRSGYARPKAFATPVVTLTTNVSLVSITQNTSTDVIVTMARENYVGLLTLGTEGLPTDVTASWPDGQTASSGVTQRVLRLTAAAAAPVVSNAAWTVTAIGEGGTPSTGLARTVSVVSASSVTPLYTTSFEGAADGANTLSPALDTADMVWSNANTVAVRVTNNSETAFLPPEYPGAVTGVKALRFNYNGTAPGGDGHSEIRWALTSSVTSLWQEFKWYIPAAFIHRNDSPNNNKWIYVFGETYGSGVNQCLVDMEFERAGSDTSSNVIPKYSLANQPSSQEVALASALLISPTGPAIAGQWNTVRLYTKMSSSFIASDGAIICEVNGTRVADFTTLRMWPSNTPVSTVAYWRKGILMGYANSGYATQTRFLVDDFKLFTTNPGWF